MKQLLTSIALLFISNFGFSQVNNYYDIDQTDSNVTCYIPNAFNADPICCHGGDGCYYILINNVDSFTVEILDSNNNPIFFSNTLDSIWCPRETTGFYVGVYTCVLTYWTELNTPRVKMFVRRQKVHCIV